MPFAVWMGAGDARLTPWGLAMNERQSIIDRDTLLGDLRLAVLYAARVGVLKNRDTIDKLEKAEAALAADQRIDTVALTSALNEIAALIAPITIADLRFERDPFLKRNHNTANTMQMVLSCFALLVLIITGDYMHALQNEQEVVTALDKIRDLKPQEKLSELRRFAQWDEPLALPRTPRSLNDQYHQKVAELVAINNTMMNTYSRALAAAAQPMIPFGRFLSAKHEATSVLGPPAPAAATTAPASNDEAEFAPCVEDANGELRLPEETKRYPKWMKTALRDSLSDMCFQLNVVAPNGGGQIPSEALSQLAFAGSIKEKIALRSGWFLPFMYGLLGAVLFVMSNIANVRTPAMTWPEIGMRISLGGLAGIVVGWFLNAVGLLPTSGLISLPFALAFLTGYGIDILFSVLDSLHQTALTAAVRRHRRDVTAQAGVDRE